jgi:hypothetical protein
MGTLAIPIAITLWSEDVLTPHNMTTVPPWTIAPRPDIEIPSE